MTTIPVSEVLTGEALIVDRDGHILAVEPANPWAGRIACPECASAEWTMPVGALAPGAQRCCACHLQWRPLATPVCHMAHEHHDREYEPTTAENCWALVRPAVQREGNLS